MPLFQTVQDHLRYYGLPFSPWEQLLRTVEGTEILAWKQFHWNYLEWRKGIKISLTYFSLAGRTDNLEQWPYRIVTQWIVREQLILWALVKIGRCGLDQCLYGRSMRVPCQVSISTTLKFSEGKREGALSCHHTNKKFMSVNNWVVKSHGLFLVIYQSYFKALGNILLPHIFKTLMWMLLFK